MRREIIGVVFIELKRELLSIIHTIQPEIRHPSLLEVCVVVVDAAQSFTVQVQLFPCFYTCKPLIIKVLHMCDDTFTICDFTPNI